MDPEQVYLVRLACKSDLLKYCTLSSPDKKWIQHCENCNFIKEKILSSIFKQ